MPGKRKKKQPLGFDKKLKQVIDPVIARALSHPLRGHILATLGDRIASPNEIAREIEIDARDLNYHFKVLVEVGMIGLVRRERRRGVWEHFYELEQPVLYLDDLAWKRMPQEIRTSASASLLQIVVDEAVEALRAGTFNARDSHQSRTAMILDEQGYDKLTKLMDETLAKVLEIREACAKDLARTGRQGIPIEVFMVGFETAAAVRREIGRAAAVDA
jgi:DNA-binding transcriptional ArsR family regulator